MTDAKIFISYRRIDASGFAGRLYDHLSARFGDESIFMDVEELDPGVDFVDFIETSVSSCDVFIILIGSQWLTAEDQGGNRRLDNPKDFVRLEVAAALRRDIRVIPILVQGARMPEPDKLPYDLQRLARLNAVEIRHEHFKANSERLARSIETYIMEDVRRGEQRIAELESLRADPEEHLKHQPNLKQRIDKFFQTSPRWVLVIGGGLCLILIFLLTYWGGSKLLTFMKSTETRSQFITDDFGVPMALIPSGAFEMGSERGFYDKEGPVHTVELDSFFLDKYEVTNARYADCVDAQVCSLPSQTSSSTRSSYYGNSVFYDYPVIHVSWNDAKTYCEWQGARLPTEAEWEKAARGDLDGKLYPWGDESPVCKYDVSNGAKFNDDADCNGTDTEPAGSYNANGYGFFDMAGNVWEWIADWYASDYYAGFPKSNPAGPSSGEYRVVRGGSWSYTANDIRAAYRGYIKPSGNDYDVGFRCAKDMSP